MVAWGKRIRVLPGEALWENAPETIRSRTAVGSMMFFMLII